VSIIHQRLDPTEANANMKLFINSFIFYYLYYYNSFIFYYLYYYYPPLGGFIIYREA